MKKTLVLIFLLFISFNSFSQKESLQTEKTKNKWVFNISPNLYIVSISESLNSLAPVDGASFSNIFDNLNINTIVQGEATSGKWSIITEFTYILLKKDDEVYYPSYHSTSWGYPTVNNSETEEVKAKLKELVFEIGTGYQFYKTEFFNLDAILGFRNFAFEKKVVSLPYEEWPKDKTFWSFSSGRKLHFNEPFIGVRFNAQKNKWKNSTRIYIGGFGIGSVFTYKFNINFGYDLFNFLSTNIGYQGYNINYNENLSTNYSYKHKIYTGGLVLGLNFKF